MDNNFVRLSDSIRDVSNSLYDNSMGLSTGIYQLDDSISGLHSGLYILAGRPSMGKSSLMLDIALSIGAVAPVAVFSLEMSRSLLIERMIANESAVNYKSMKRNLLSSTQMDLVSRTVDNIESMPIYIDDSSLLTTTHIKAKLDVLRETVDFKAVMIDYLQLMCAVTANNRQQEITEISRVLASLSKYYAVPFVVLSQLNRAVEFRENHRPRLADLRESGSIEQDADVVLLLHRPSYYTILDNPFATDSGKAEIIVAKQRNGELSVVNCNWNSQSMSFRDRIVDLESF